MHYDLIVIGSGGGTKISTPAAKLGKKVAIIEKENYGGTCLNKGCIPSKMLIHPANVLAHAKDAKKFGITTKHKVNFFELVKRITREITAESNSIPKSYDSIETLDHYEGHAKFLDDKTVEVNGKKITGDMIIIATGTLPTVPKIPGLDGTPYLTSKEALRNSKLPKKLIIIGGGYIACELGHAYQQYGSKTHFLVRSGLIGHEDDEVREEFAKVFEKHHKIDIGVKLLFVKYRFGKFTVEYEIDGKKRRAKGDDLLVATGVHPNTENLGLENTSVQITQRGFIAVDEHLKTRAENIYALGDVVGNYLFRHSVNFEGEYLFEQLFGGEKKKPIKYPPMPHAVFSHPEVAGVGKTEKQLQEEGADYVVGKNSYKASAQGMARMPDHGFVKLLFDKKTQKLLGAHIIGDEASIMIHQAIYAMTYSATLDDLLNIIYIHPALPEVFRNACRNAKKEFDSQ